MSISTPPSSPHISKLVLATDSRYKMGMTTIALIGAGSTVFAKNILGDCLCTPCLAEARIALTDINPERLRDSEMILRNLNASLGTRVTISATTDRREALKGADFVINTIQVGGYEPSTVIDFEIPKKYGLRQTIGDTLGIGGIFRALRTIPVVLEIARDIEEICPDAWLLNYTNPVPMIVGAVLRATPVRTVGLCHSVQVCATYLCRKLDLPASDLQARIAGINHQAWLLELTRQGEDLYPEVRRRAGQPEYWKKDPVRFEIMKRFGYFVTESSEHSAEYLPYFIKSRYPDLIDRYQIPLDEYPRRCVAQIADWKKMRDGLVADTNLKHRRTHEYGSYIIEAMLTDEPFRISGNVLNHGLIPNLPEGCCVEVPCLVDRNGIQPCVAGPLPPQCAAINRTNINAQELTIEAALTRRRDHIYHAALLDPHTSAELSIDDTVALCDELIAAHGTYLPTYN